MARKALILLVVFLLVLSFSGTALAGPGATIDWDDEEGAGGGWLYLPEAAGRRSDQAISNPIRVAGD